MGAFTSVTFVAEKDYGTNSRSIFVSAVGPASYDADGSTIDLSTWFTVVYKVKLAGRAPGGSTAGCGFDVIYKPATAYAAASGKLVISNIWQATPAEASGDMSTTPGTLLLEVCGR